MSRGKRVARRFALAGTWALGIVAAVMVAAVLLFYSFTRVPEPSDLKINQMATILYSDGNPMASVGTVNRTIVPLAKCPQHVRWAVLAAEDRSFYSEPGVSIRGTLRAALTDLRGGDTQGGSGITQQYVKNAYLNSERTAVAQAAGSWPSRSSWTGSIRRTRSWSGTSTRSTSGAGRTASRPLRRPISAYRSTKLTVSQGALLAGLIQAPQYYDPRINPAAAEARWNYVLDGMVTTQHLAAGTARSGDVPEDDRAADHSTRRHRS